MFDGYCDSIRLTPSSFDAAKTYNAAVFVPGVADVRACPGTARDNLGAGVHADSRGC